MDDATQIALRTFRSARRQLLRLKMAEAHRRLAGRKCDQERVFNFLKEDFAAIYAILKPHDISRFTTPVWQKYIARLEARFLPAPPFEFLSDPTIMETMFVTRAGRCLKEELKFLEQTVSKERLKVLLEEDLVGKPMLFSGTYLTSHNSIHHLYHLIRFSKRTNCDLNQINSVVEWGGGYGNLAKIFRRFGTKPTTYVIVDIPLSSCIQWLYLATCIGPGAVTLLQRADDRVAPGQINILPLCFVDSVNVSAKLFVSTWALSESSSFSQDFVAGRNWFDAKHILLAYQRSNPDAVYADRMQKIAAFSGAVSEEIKFLPGNYYSFR